MEVEKCLSAETVKIKIQKKRVKIQVSVFSFVIANHSRTIRYAKGLALESTVSFLLFQSWPVVIRSHNKPAIRFINLHNDLLELIRYANLIFQFF